MAAPAESLLAFVGFFPTDDGAGLAAAAMVTNERGYPLEFRVSTPVRASAVQRALYGKSLEPYVVSELIGRRIVAELQRRPSVVLVNRVGAVEIPSTYPIVFVTRADDYVRTDGESLDYRRVESAAAPSLALAVLSSRGSTNLDSCTDTIRRAFSHFDPIEAFDRMKTALGVLAESDDRYR